MESIVIPVVFAAAALAALRWGADSRDPGAAESLVAWAVGRAAAQREGAMLDAVESDLALERVGELRAEADAHRRAASPRPQGANGGMLARAAAFRIGSWLVGWGERLALHGEGPKLSGLP